MATDWKLCLQCDSSQASNSFTAPSNLWMSRAQGATGWNPAGTSTPQAVVGDNLYVEVTDGAASPVGGKLIGYLISSMKVSQTDVTPFRKNNNSAKPKLCVLSDDAPRSNGVWTWGPYEVFQTGQFEFTFSAVVKDPGNEQSDSWEEDPEFDVSEGP